MKVTGAGSTSAAGSVRAADRPVDSGFGSILDEVGEAAAPAATARAEALGAISSLDVLLALQ